MGKIEVGDRPAADIQADIAARDDDMAVALMELTTKARREGWARGRFEDEWNGLMRTSLGLPSGDALFPPSSEAERQQVMPPLAAEPTQAEPKQ